MLEVLGSGSSAAGGFWWFLVGKDRQTVFWVAKQDWADAGDPSGYEVRRFVSGQRFESCPPANDRETADLLEFASGLEPGGDLPWHDDAKAAELYRAYVGGSG